jgi:hypothetical protein
VKRTPSCFSPPYLHPRVSCLSVSLLFCGQYSNQGNIKRLEKKKKKNKKYSNVSPHRIGERKECKGPASPLLVCDELFVVGK